MVGTDWIKAPGIFYFIFKTSFEFVEGDLSPFVSPALEMSMQIGGEVPPVGSLHSRKKLRPRKSRTEVHGEISGLKTRKLPTKSIWGPYHWYGLPLGVSNTLQSLSGAVLTFGPKTSVFSFFLSYSLSFSLVFSFTYLFCRATWGRSSGALAKPNFRTRS